jgi:hypothetical protein
MIDTTLLTQQLAEANLAYHQLVTGTMPRVIVDQNGEKVEFTAANKASLAAYIGQLQGALGVTPALAVTSPAMFFF